GRDLLPVPLEGSRPVRDAVRRRSQLDPAARRADRPPRQSLSHRCHHRPVGGLRGVGESRRVPHAVRLAAQRQAGGVAVRFLSWPRACDQAAGAESRARGIGAEHDRVQRWRRNRPAVGAQRNPARNELLAKDCELRAARVRGQRGTADGRLRPHRAATHRLRDRPMNALPPSSRRRLLLSTVIALLVAGVILITVVLPAEYGIDPLRIGSLTGLDVLGTSKANRPITEVMHTHPRKYYSGNIVITLEGRE